MPADDTRRISFPGCLDQTPSDDEPQLKMVEANEPGLHEKQRTDNDPENLQPVQLASKRVAVPRLPIDDVVRQMAHHLRDDQRRPQ